MCEESLTVTSTKCLPHGYTCITMPLYALLFNSPGWAQLLCCSACCALQKAVLLSLGKTLVTANKQKPSCGDGTWVSADAALVLYAHTCRMTCRKPMVMESKTLTSASTVIT
jgi:hypothetical protein